jgi:hypothetical protein
MNKLLHVSHQLFCVGLVLFLFAGSIHAQTELPSEQVQVVKDFDARLEQAERLSMAPQLPPFDTTQLEYDFIIQERILDYDYNSPKIRAIGVPRSESIPAYSTYALAGYGIPNSPLGNFNTTISGEDYRFFIDANHYGVDNRNNVENQFLSETNFQLGGQYQFHDLLAVKGGLQYTFNVNDLYGYDSEIDSFSREDAARRFSTWQTNLAVFSPEATSWGFSYGVDFNYRNYSDNLESNENLTALDGVLRWEINEKNIFNLDIESDFLSWENFKNQELNNFILRPTYTYQANRWSVEAGVFWAKAGEENILYPELMAQFALMDQKLVAFAGLSGNVQAQGFHHLTLRNPYYRPDSLSPLNNTWSLDIFAGVKGRMQQLTYQFSASYQQVNQLAFFGPYTTDFSGYDSRFFATLFDDGSITELSLYTSYPVTPKLTTSLNLSQKFVQLDQLEEPIHLPTFTTNLRTEYTIFNPSSTIWLDLRYQNGVSAISGSNLDEIEQLDGLFDISIGADYFFSEHWGAFVHVYNATNNTRQQWINYPIIGRNVLGGLMVRF